MVHEVQNTEVAFAENNGKLIYLSGPLRTSNVSIQTSILKGLELMMV